MWTEVGQTFFTIHLFNLPAESGYPVRYEVHTHSNVSGNLVSLR